MIGYISLILILQFQRDLYMCYTLRVLITYLEIAYSLTVGDDILK
jgi:hypothetical protein